MRPSLTIFLFISFTTLFAQNRINDLLKKADEINNDSLKIEYWIEACHDYQSVSPSSGLLLIKKATDLPESKSNEILQIKIQIEKIELLFRLGQFDNGITTGESILSQAEKYPTLLASLYNSLGKCYTSKGKFGKATNYFTQALIIYQKVDNKKGIGKIYLNLGNAFFYKGDIQSAEKFYRTGLPFASNNEAVLAGYYLDLGTAMAFQGRINDTTIQFINMAIMLYDKLGDINELGDCFNTLGAIYSQQGNHQKSMECFTKALEHFEKSESKEKIVIAKINLADQLKQLQDLSGAEKNILEAKQLAEEINYKRGLMGANLVLGNLKLLEGERNESQKVLDSNKILITQSANKEMASVSNIFEGEAAATAGNIVTYKNDLLKALKLAKESGHSEYMNVAIANLANVYDTLNKADSALFYYRQLNAIKDSIYNTNTTHQLLELQTKYETQKKSDSLKIQDQELLISKQQLSKRTILLAVISSSVIFLILMIYFIYQLYKKTKTDRERIDLLRHELQHKVKNDLAILIRLAEASVKKEESNIPVKELGSRIKSIAMVHEQLYGTENISQINFKNFVGLLSKQIQQSFGTGFHLINKVDPRFELPVDKATSLALIINELLTNSFKYAFKPGATNYATISLIEENKIMKFHYFDNGAGITDAIDGFGMKLIRGLSSQLGGSHRIWNDGGFNFELILT